MVGTVNARMPRVRKVWSTNPGQAHYTTFKTSS